MAPLERTKRRPDLGHEDRLKEIESHGYLGGIADKK
jgi:hypothetical protein